MDILTLSLGQRVKFLREQKKLSQNEFAKKCNVSPAAVCMWEKNDKSPTKNNLLQIARVLGVSYEDLTGEKE